MNTYQTYMDRQTVSDGLHEKLLALEVPQKRQRSHRFDFGALAACAVLFVGIGAGWLIAGPQSAHHGPDVVVPLTTQSSDPAESENVLAVEPTLEPVENAPALDAADTGAFRLMENQVKAHFYALPALKFVDASGALAPAASIALPEGSFEVDLTLTDLQRVFWGKDGKPENLEPDTELPWALYWGGCTVWARAIYDGGGNLWQLTVHGEREGDEFTLEVTPDHLPVQCCVILPDWKAATTEVNGVAVTSWYQSYDRDGDDKDEVVCTSEFMVNGYGVRFQNVGAPQMTGETYDREASIYFNTLFVRQALDDGGLYMDDLARNENIPNWRSQQYTTLGKARMEEEFAPYLPESAPYGGKGEFNSFLQYQEGNYNQMWVHWYRNYDYVEVAVYLPEGEGGFDYTDEPVDVNVPESYDWRLYDIPICDNVPEEYQMSFSKPTFRARDMSLEIVKARMHPHDTGGEICSFYVLHENGVVVGYNCSGVSAEYVWSLVEPTLAAGRK